MSPLLSLLLLSGCKLIFSDPLNTGVRVAPPPAAYTGPVDLIVHNDLPDALACVAFESDVCPSLSALSGLSSLASGDRWELDEVSCAEIDVSCWLQGAPQTERPLRAWGWSIVPPLDEEE